MEANENLFEHGKHRPTLEELFGSFIEAAGCQETLAIFQNIKNSIDLGEHEHSEVYDRLKTRLTSWKCQSLWDLLDARAKHVEYGKGKICNHLSVLIIGGGPIGLRTAIETALLGCRTVIVEKRREFTRNNVLHLWPFLLTDFRGLGAKKFYGKFCAGSIDHISIKQLQSILMKVCLMLGVEIHTGVEYKDIIEPTQDHGWKAQFSPYKERLDKFVFDVVVGADGKKDMLPGFRQIEMRGALAIGITCNFVNENTVAEAGVEEISGVAYQFNPQFFNDLNAQFGVGLENIVYYKDDTHYFVFTALKSSLLKRNVFKQDFSDPGKLLEKQNIDLDQLIQFALDTVHYATKYQLPKDLKLVQNANGTPDIAVFDFTSLKKAANASRIVERKGKRLLMALVGDSLLEPFWPTGSGCGRGVLTALDTAWMIRLLGVKMSPLAVLRERENVFKLLPGTDSNNLQKNHKAFTINPSTRYSTLNQVQSVNAASLKKLYDTDDPENADYSLPDSVAPSKFEIGRAATMPPPRNRRKSGGKRRLSSSANKRRSDRTTLREARHVSKTMAMWENKMPKKAEPGGPTKKTKPSHSGSHSGSSSLESVSESEHEESGAPYQRARVLRARQQSNEALSDVFTGSSADELGEIERKMLLPDNYKAIEGASAVCKISEDAPMASEQGKGEKVHHKGGIFRRLLGKGHSHHDVQRRKSIAARKSISKARRIRRKSGAGSQSSQSQPETDNTALLPKHGHDSVTVRKRPQRAQVAGEQGESAFKVPSIPAEKTEDTKVSARSLIAAAEARDQQRERRMGVGKSDSLKRKADDTSGDTRNESVPWTHCLAAVEPFLQEEGQKKDDAQPVKHASQLAGLLLLSVPLLLPCRTRLVGKHSSMLAEKRNTLFRSSIEKRETRKISMTRAGSVQRAVAQIKTKLEQDTSSSNYADFKRNRSSGSFKRDSLHSSGKTSPFLSQSVEETQSSQLDVSLNTDEYEIIEVKSAVLQPKEVVRIVDDFDVISGSEVKMESLDQPDSGRQKKLLKKPGQPKTEEIIRDMLSQICRGQRLTSVQITLEILGGIHRSIANYPGVDKYYRIYTKGKNFEMYVWNSDICRKFLKHIGWEVCGSFIVLSKSVRIQEPLKFIDEAKSDVEQLLRNRSKSNTGEASLQFAESATYSVPNGGSKPVNKEVRDSIDGLSAPYSPDDLPDGIEQTINCAGFADQAGIENVANLADSSGRETIDSDSLEDQVESSEGYIGDEEYLIVDFAKEKTHLLNERSGKALKKMDDEVYGKDGRRRKRRSFGSKESKGIEETVLETRVPLRRRLKERGASYDLGQHEPGAHSKLQTTISKKNAGGTEEKSSEVVYDEEGRRRREKISDHRPNNYEKSTFYTTKTDIPEPDDSYGERGRRKRDRLSTEKQPPSTKPALGGSRVHSVSRGTLDTATTHSKSKDNESKRLTDREKKACEMDQTDLSENRLLCPNEFIKDDASSQEKEKIDPVFSRLEILRRESDSSGSDSGKKKKLVLKRGSMRRKKQQESEQNSNSSSSGTDIKSNSNSCKQDNKDNSMNKIMKENKIQGHSDETLHEAPASKPTSKVSNFSKVLLHENDNKISKESEKVEASTEITGKSGIKEIIARLNETKLNNEKDVVKEGSMVSNDSTSVISTKIGDDKTLNGLGGHDKEPKKDKKRKLVLKVKRKKAKSDEDSDKTTPAPPVESRDPKPGVNKEPVEEKTKEVSACKENVIRENGVGNKMEKSVNKQIVKSNLESSKLGKVKIEKNDFVKKIENGEDKDSKEEQKTVNENENDSSHPKKKKFVLKRKKKAAS